MDEWAIFLYSKTQPKYVLTFYAQFMIDKLKVSDHFYIYWRINKKQFVVEIMVVKVQEEIGQIWAQNSRSFIVCTSHLYSWCWK